MINTHGLTLKRIIGYTAVVLATLAFLVVIYRLQAVVLLFILSIIMAAALRPGVVALEQRRIPRGFAILAWYLLIIGVFALGIYLIGGPLGQELQALGNAFPLRYDDLVGRYQAAGDGWQQSVAQRLPTTDVVIQSLGEGGATEIGFQIAGFASGIVNVVVSLVAILTLTFYWLIDQDRFERLWLTLMPVQQRAIARHTWRGIEHRVGAYLRSEAAQFVVTIAALSVAFRLLDVAYPSLFAVYAGVVQLIPWVGIPLTMLPLAFMVFTSPWWLILATGIVIVVIGTLMDRFLEPWLRGDAVVHPILTVLALMIMGEFGGILGMLIALPLAATLQIVLSEMMRISIAPKAMTVSMEATQIQELRKKIASLREDVPKDPEHRREAEGMLQRLQALLDRAEDVVGERARTGNSSGAPASSRRRVPASFGRTKTS